MSKNIFLDDLRDPKDAFAHTNQPMFLEWEWSVVRSFDEFAEWIHANGLPDFVSFDHDLHNDHYTPQHLWSDYEASKAWQDAQVYDEPNGLHCALFLIIFCKTKGFDLPEWYCHSMNPVGKDNISVALNSFKFLTK